ncbi:MAG: DUF423 domain-containing protein [Planctomycetes bacterium]|nr:DUF423 domain-containing protein [Planctomycetota bacterium]
MAFCHQEIAGGTLLSCKTLVRLAFLLAAIAVGCAAAAAHLLDGWLDSSHLHQWEVAARILFWHALGLWICGRGYRGPGNLMLVSTVIFCGSVLALSVGASSWLGVLAPIGGTGLIISWLWLAVAAPPG